MNESYYSESNSTPKAIWISLFQSLADELYEFASIHSLKTTVMVFLLLLEYPLALHRG